MGFARQTKVTTTQGNWYEFPQYYDLAFRSETRREAAFIDAICRMYCPFPVRRLFEPACGTGRLVCALAERGYHVTGLDLCRPALQYAQKRLARRGLAATLMEGDMARFRLDERIDAAYCTFNSFRHLLSEREAQSHLECVARALRPGGIYILGLHLIPIDADDQCTERWTARHGRLKLTVTLRVVHTDWRRRIERLRVSMLARTPRSQRRLRSEFSLRLYRASHFRRLLKAVPAFQLREVYDFWYEVDHPVVLNDQLSDAVFILQKRAGR